MSVPPDRYGVALAFVGSAAAPASPVDVVRVQGSVILERDLSQSSGTLFFLSRPFNPKTAPEPNRFATHNSHARTRKSSSTERKKLVLPPPPPPASDPLPQRKKDFDSSSDDDSDSSGGLPVPEQRSTNGNPKDVLVAKPGRNETNSQEPVTRRVRHGHRRSLSTSEHLHFAGKAGPPVLTPLAFQPRDDDDSSDDEQDKGSVIVRDDEIGSVASNSSRLSVVRVSETPKGGDSPKANGRSPASGEPIYVNKGLSRVLAIDAAGSPHSPPGGQRRIGLGSPNYRPRRSSAPDLDSIVESGAAMPGSTRSAATLSTASPRSYGNASENDSTRSSKSTRRHYRQLSAPVIVGGVVEADGGGDAVATTELKLPDGLVITRSGISSNSSTPDYSSALQHFGAKRSPTGPGEQLQLDVRDDVSQRSSTPADSSNPSPRPPSRMFNPDDLETLGLIGKGTAGIVTKAIHVSALRIVAVKSIQRFDVQKIETTIAEVRALYRHMIRFDAPLPDPNSEEASCIVGFYDAYVLENGSNVNLVLEYMDGGSLQDLVDKYKAAGRHLSEDFISIACRKMLKGLCELYDARLLHRDMKPANVLVSHTGAIKLSDFGVSVTFKTDELSNAKTFVGSLSYMAPERVSSENYSYASDLWGVGLIAYVCATGDYPFTKQYDTDGFWGMVQALMDEVPALDPTKFSPEFVDFVAQCLRRDPEERPTAQEHLNHPFVTKFVGKPKLAKKIVQETLGPIDQTAARKELMSLLRRAAARNVNNAISHDLTLPRFPLQKIRSLSEQLGVEFTDEQELADVTNEINSQMMHPKSWQLGNSRGDKTTNVSPASAASSQDPALPADLPAWKKSNLRLDVTM